MLYNHIRADENFFVDTQSHSLFLFPFPIDRVSFRNQIFGKRRVGD